jgi:hypothetical protein
MMEDPGEFRASAPSPEKPRQEEWTAIPLPVAQPGLPACELRWERPIEADETGAVEIVCMAAGEKALDAQSRRRKDLERVTQKLIQYQQDVWAGRIRFPRLYPAPVEWPKPLPRWKQFLQDLLVLWQGWMG